MPNSKPGIIGSREVRDTEREISKRPTPIQVTSLTPNATNLVIEFDQAVSLKGTPQYTTDVAGAVPVSAVMNNATTLRLTFDQDVSLATTVNIPYQDPAIRNGRGGYVTPTSIAA